jgi:hypothetical protein
MPKLNVRFRDNPILVTWGLLVLFSVIYELASIRWPRASYWALDGASEYILLFTGGLLALAWIGRMVEDINDAFRSARNNIPRLICAARVARLAWEAWEIPGIADRREALEGRALADKRALERAMVEAAHRQATEEISR